MIQPLEQITQQISRTDQLLQYHLIMEQKETNRLLRELLGKKTEVNPVDDLKRPELMKSIAKLENKPQGWNTWATDKMREYLKGAS